MTYRHPPCPPASRMVDRAKLRLAAIAAAARTLTAAALMAVLLIVLSQPGIVYAQTEERWYQIEISLFAHESDNLGEEHWPQERLPSEFPANARQLTSRMDFLDLPDWEWLSESTRFEDLLSARQSDFRLPDIERDAFVALPASEHNFSDTNRALVTSSNYRLLYHSAWRQPLELTGQTRPLLITGGRPFDDRHELEGSLIIGFNPGRDRVILETDLWLTQFTTLPSAGPELSLPPRPAELLSAAPDMNEAAAEWSPETSAARRRASALAPTGFSGQNNSQGISAPTYYPARIIPVRSERAMRSREFHYLDHPAVGIIVEVFPYTPPSAPASLPFLETDSDQL